MTVEKRPVPMFDLARAAARVDGELLRRWRRILDETAFVGGAEVQEFERSFADFLEVEHCVGVANGTDELEVALRAHCVGPGDEVVVPAPRRSSPTSGRTASTSISKTSRNG